MDSWAGRRSAIDEQFPSGVECGVGFRGEAWLRGEEYCERCGQGEGHSRWRGDIHRGGSATALERRPERIRPVPGNWSVRRLASRGTETPAMVGRVVRGSVDHREREREQDREEAL